VVISEDYWEDVVSDFEELEADSSAVSGQDWSAYEALLEVEEKERHRLKNQLSTVKKRMKSREKICQSVKDELDKEIRRQKNRLETAQSSDEIDIRDRLRELYRERREEVRSDWQDRKSLLDRKLELERELAELRDLENLLD